MRKIFAPLYYKTKVLNQNQNKIVQHMTMPIKTIYAHNMVTFNSMNNQFYCKMWFLFFKLSVFVIAVAIYYESIAL